MFGIFMKLFRKMLNKSKEEKGIALLFALLILSLLLVLALSFATNSIFEQRAAYNASNASKAKVLARSTLNRIMAMLAYYDNTIYYSHSNYATSSQNTTDYLNKLTTMEGGSYVFEWSSSYGSKVNWEYVRVDLDGDGNDDNNPIIGRVAYVMMPGGELDAAACVESGKNEGSYPELRVGKEVNEINLQSLDSSIIDSTLATKMSYDDVTGGVLPTPAPGTWLDFPTMFSRLSFTNSNATEKAWFRKWFVIDPGKDDEAFWIDNDGNGMIDRSTELYSRFSLVRTDWSDLYGAADSPKSNMETMLSAPALWSTEDGGIPWLTYFGVQDDSTDDDTLKGTFSDVATRRKQIIANFLDYNDSDDTPTSDVSPGSWSGSTPTYTGNERTPYLNEIMLKITRHASADNTSGNCTASFSIEATAEVVNMYGQTFGSPIKVTLSGQFDSGVVVGGTSFDPTWTNFVATDVNYASGMSGKKYLAEWTSACILGQLPALTFAGSSASVDPVSIKLSKAILSYNSNNVDIVNFNDLIITIPDSVSVASAPGDVTQTTFVSVYCSDPRQNLNASDWTVKSQVSTYSTDSASLDSAMNSAMTLEATNVNPKDIYDSGDADWKLNHDKEDATGQADISTAYIRNGSMESPWELGLIHRGKAWQTINLKKYDAERGYKAGTGTVKSLGGRKYSYGDANILDQIKMNSNSENPKKVSLGTQRNEILTALFDRIRLNCPVGTPGDTSKLAITNIPDLVDAVKSNSNNFKTRAAVVNCGITDVATEREGIFSNGTVGTQANDRTQEEVIGKFINLTEIAGKGEYFTLIVLAQTIKDVGGNASNISIYKNDNSNNRIEIPSQIGRFDYHKVSDTEYLYADEITSEQKIMVKIHRDSTTNECKIVGFEYVE